jgi:hypothetical protein
MISSAEFMTALKIILAVSVFFVWVVRYQNIVKEFEHYNLAPWVRDLVGIIKLTCVTMILFPSPGVVVLGSAGLAILMFIALLTHFKVKNPVTKMIPALTLLSLSFLVFYHQSKVIPQLVASE